MYFTVSRNNLQTSEDFGYTAYCPGAEWISIYSNYDDDSWDSRDYNDTDSCSDYESYRDAGTYKLVALGYKNVDDDAVEVAQKANYDACHG